MNNILKERQAIAYQILQNSYLNNRLSHAYIFSGGKGTYKKEMAYHLALMLYLGAEPDYDSNLAKTILGGNHLNITYIEPLGQNIKKEQIIALQEEFSKTSQFDGPRIYIINEADTMTVSAANSLLKFIEEPTSQDTYGILITEHNENILPTIRSRSVTISFKSISKHELKEELAKEGFDENYLDILAYIASDTNEAKELIDDVNFNETYEALLAFVNQLKIGKMIKLFFRAKQNILMNKDNAKMFLDMLLGFYRDMLEFKIKNDVINFPNLRESIEEVSNKYDFDGINNSIESILDLLNKVDFYVNLSLNFDALFSSLEGGMTE